MDNVYIHLVNNSIGKNSENFHKEVIAEDGQKIEGYMWPCSSFADYLKFKSGEFIYALKKKTLVFQ